VANDVQSRSRAYGDVLYAIRGLFDLLDKVSRDEFHQLRQRSRLANATPGSPKFSFAARVLHGRKLEFERAVAPRKSLLLKGLPEFAIKAPGERPEYAVLTYLAPMGKERPAWGLDLNADPLRRSVTDRARDSGQIASSSGVTLLRDGNASVSSTLLRLALYRGGGVPESVEERQRLYWGMVGSTLRIGEMIDATLSKEILSRAQLQIYEAGEGAAGGTLLFDSTAASTVAPAEFSGYGVTRRLAVGDREWRLRIVPRKDPVDLLDKAGIAAILAALLAISALLFWLMTSVANLRVARRRAREAQPRGGAAARKTARAGACTTSFTGLYNRHYVEEWFGPGAAPRAAPRQADRRHHGGRRSLQAFQRQLRPRSRRPGAAGAGGRAQAVCAEVRRRLPVRRPRNSSCSCPSARSTPRARRPSNFVRSCKARASV